jgi:tetratricopeptide (TPR) repeat protein
LHLLPQAGAQCRAAIKAAEGAADLQQKRAALRAWAADALEQAIKEAVSANNLVMAKNALKLLTTRLADQRSEEQIDAVTKTVEELGEKQDAIKAQKQQARLDQKARESIDQRMKPIQKDMQQGDKYLGDAIRKSRSTAASAKLCDQAVDSYKRSYKALQDLVAKFPDDGDLSTSASSLVAHMHDQAIRAGLHAANMLTVQSDFKGAMEWAQRILAFEPENAEAKEMVKTIQMASAEASGDWDWRWMTVGGDRPMPQDDPRSR